MTRRVLLVIILFIMTVSAGLNTSDYFLTGGTTGSENVLAFTGNQDSYVPVLTYSTVSQTEDPSFDIIIEKSKKMGIVGTVLHFSGFALSAVSVPITLSEIRARRNTSKPFPSAGLTLSIIGMVMSATGPIPSCAGASIIEDAMEDASIRFSRNRYWSFYARGWAYEVAAWSTYTIGTLVTRDTQTKVAPILLLIGLYTLEVGSEIYRAVSAIGPILYAEKARSRIKKVRSVKVNVLPLLTVDGAAGVACQVLF